MHIFQPLGYQYTSNKPSTAHGTESAHVAIARSSANPPDGDAEFELPLALVLVADELVPLRLWLVGEVIGVVDGISDAGTAEMGPGT